MKEKANEQFEKETFFHSVFVNQYQMVEETKDLKKGQAIQITGRANVTTEKDEAGYDQNILKSIKATKISLDPFSYKTEDVPEHEI